MVEHLLCKQGVIGSNPIVSRLVKARALPPSLERGGTNGPCRVAGA